VKSVNTNGIFSFFHNLVNQVVYTDETAICVTQRQSQFVRKCPGQRFRHEHLALRSGYPVKVMFWGSFSGKGLGSLHVCQGTINSQAHISILQQHLLRTAASWFPDSPWTLLQDNAPCHNSRLTKKWLQDHDVQLMSWPANSPDLNPIENLWGMLKQKLRKTNSSSKAHLIEKTLNVWNNDSELKTCVQH
jgi:hypothetical protein